MGNQGVTSPVKNCNTNISIFLFSGKKETRLFKDLCHPGRKNPNELLISSRSNISNSKGKKQQDN